MKFDAEKNVNQLNTWDVIKSFFDNKFGKVIKEDAFSKAPVPAPQNAEINYVAIVLDGYVQEVIRAENKLAALLLSGPEFIGIKDAPDRPTIGWSYSDGVFEKPDSEYFKEHNHGHNHPHTHEH